MTHYIPYHIIKPEFDNDGITFQCSYPQLIYLYQNWWEEIVANRGENEWLLSQKVLGGKNNGGKVSRNNDLPFLEEGGIRWGRLLHTTTPQK